MKTYDLQQFYEADLSAKSCGCGGTCRECRIYAEALHALSEEDLAIFQDYCNAKEEG